MAIRDHDSPQSGTQNLEDEWFKKADIMNSDLNRFLYMQKGTMNKTWDMRVDISTMVINNELDWMIDHDKYVNRPDAIAHKFYGNSKYWWIIAERNEITDPFHGFHKGKKLKIPDLDILKRKLGF